MHCRFFLHSERVRRTGLNNSHHGVDGLLSDIELGGSVALALGSQARLADTVDLLVDLGTVMVSLLTGTSDGERHTRRMPRSDTSDL